MQYSGVKCSTSGHEYNTEPGVHYSKTSTDHFTPIQTKSDTTHIPYIQYCVHVSTMTGGLQENRAKNARRLGCILVSANKRNCGSFHRFAGSWMMPQDPGWVQVKFTRRSRHCTGRLTQDFAERQPTTLTKRWRRRCRPGFKGCRKQSPLGDDMRVRTAACKVHTCRWGHRFCHSPDEMRRFHLLRCLIT